MKTYCAIIILLLTTSISADESFGYGASLAYPNSSLELSFAMGRGFDLILENPHNYNKCYDKKYINFIILNDPYNHDYLNVSTDFILMLVYMLSFTETYPSKSSILVNNFIGFITHATAVYHSFPSEDINLFIESSMHPFFFQRDNWMRHSIGTGLSISKAFTIRLGYYLNTDTFLQTAEGYALSHNMKITVSSLIDKD